MQPQDVYNRAFDTTTASLDKWIDTIRDVASVEGERTDSYWRSRIRPFETNTCPIELMISRDQTFDLDIWTESVVRQPVSDLPFFQSLLQATADGDVVCRAWLAHATGHELQREIVAKLAGGQEWSIRRRVSAGIAATELSAVARDRVFLAYRR